MAITIVFIDNRVKDLEYLISQLAPNVEYNILDGSRDGIEQIASALWVQGRYDSIQIISHGAAGSIVIGSTVLNSANLTQYKAELSVIGNSLTATGELLLYGCDVAAGAEGLQFIDTLSRMTGADVAASTDSTGGSAAGGNWVLEASTGAYDQAVVLNAEGYNGLLALANSAPSVGLPGTLSFAPKVDYGTNLSPFFVDTADFNGDGKTDMVVADLSSNNVSVFLNNGTGAFGMKVDYITGAGPMFIVSGYVNGDGSKDLVIANYFANTVSVLLNNGSGSFAAPVNYTVGS